MAGKAQHIKPTKTLSNRNRTDSIDTLRVAAYCRVSTDHKEQLDSYETQKKHYEELIAEKPEWVKVGIYADEAISGTSTKNRNDFNRLINDCMEGRIDLVLTKSISRFARNTKDTLDYVRKLREKGIAVLFEAESINTMTMDGELLLTILAAVSQQYVENLSTNVKFSLRKKMEDGILIGRHDCLGYDYNKETGTLNVNDAEAEVVRYIFRRYIEGAGGMIIGRELESLGHKTKKGRATWGESTVVGIIKNEKYIGTLVQGKTFTADTMTKWRIENRGESDLYRWENKHEAIIDVDTFEQAQAILKRRNANRSKIDEHGRRERYSRKYTFSCMLKCGFCGSNLSRRSWHSGSDHQKWVWQCVVATKHGKHKCPNSKGLEETIIESAFVQSYQLMCGTDNKAVLSEFLGRMEASMRDTGTEKQLAKVEKRIETLELKSKRLLDALTEFVVSDKAYKEKQEEFDTELAGLYEQRELLRGTKVDERQIQLRLADFKRTLEANETLTAFDKVVFEASIDKVIVGFIGEDGEVDPYKLTYVYKTGLESIVDGKNAYSFTQDNTCGSSRFVRKTIESEKSINRSHWMS